MTETATSAGQVVDVNGLPTYYEVHGSGPSLLFLHGGIVWSGHYRDQMRDFPPHFRSYFVDRRGHGHTSDVEGPIAYEDMADDTVAFMDAMKIERAHFVGHSDGAIVGMLVAANHPERVDKLVLAAGVFHFNGITDECEEFIRDRLLQSDNDELGDEYAAVSPNGRDHFPVFLRKMQELFLTAPTMTTDDLSRINAPTLIVAGDRDWVKFEHLLDQFRSIPDAQLFVVPGTDHFFLWTKSASVNKTIIEFLT